MEILRDIWHLAHTPPPAPSERGAPDGVGWGSIRRKCRCLVMTSPSKPKGFATSPKRGGIIEAPLLGELAALAD